MIKFEHTEVVGWEAAIRGMRNPKNSWDKSDSYYSVNGRECAMGCADHKLAMMLRNAGTDHRKFMRMLVVYVDITAPLFWWKEFDTYKVGTVRNSCSTMHKIHVAKFTEDMFSHEGIDSVSEVCSFVKTVFSDYLNTLEFLRNRFNSTQDKMYWRALIEMLPEGFNMKATVELNYEVLANIYKPGSRKFHKLDEWNVKMPGSFCAWIESLPYSELITGEEDADEGGN